MGLILGLAMYVGLIFWAPYAFEMNQKTLIHSVWFRLLTGLYAIVLGLFIWRQPQNYDALAWVSSLMLLALVDAKNTSVRIMDLAIMSLCALPLMNHQVILHVMALCGLILVVLLGLKWVLRMMYKQNALGGADIWVMITILMALGGRSAIIAIYSAVILSAIIGGIYLLVGKKKRTSTLPFIPFLSFGVVIAVFFSSPILNFYSKLIMMQ